MAYGDGPGAALSIVALGCAAAAFLGYGPLLAVAGMVCAALAMARGESLAGAAVLVTLVVLVLSFVLPPAVVLGRL